MPKEGGWFVQDERGGTVHCLEAPDEVKERAINTFEKIKKAYIDSHFFMQGKEKTLDHQPLYARVDIIKTSSGPKVWSLLPKCFKAEFEKANKPEEPNNSNALKAALESMCASSII